MAEDGTHYIVTGQKQFITNAGFADLFIVYAKVDGERFSTFIIERDREGVIIGPEEKKMGIKGSSTCPLILDHVRVPAENLLWEAGKGHLIAFNILNIGRFKLAAGCLGACKEALALAAEYANLRQQFGQPIASFPLIRRKLADMNIRTFVLESMVYRTAGLLDAALSAIDLKEEGSGLPPQPRRSPNMRSNARSTRYSVQRPWTMSPMKACRSTADTAISRNTRSNASTAIPASIGIFEGTNEINRLLIPGTLLKRAMKGELPLMQNLQNLQSELLTYMPALDFGDEPLAEETHLLTMAKKIFLMTGGLAVQRYQLALEQEQEILADLADMMIAIYAAESALLRAKKLQEQGGEAKAACAAAMASAYVHESFAAVEALARRCLSSMESGDALRTQLSILKKLSRRNPVNLTQLKRQIAERVVKEESYVV